MSEDFKKGLIKYGLENNYIERTEEGLKFVGSRYNNTEQQNHHGTNNKKYGNKQRRYNGRRQHHNRQK